MKIRSFPSSSFPIKRFALKNSRRSQAQGGYTLLEIMLVVGIIVILLGGAVFFMAGNLEVGKMARADADIKTLTTQLKTYEMTMLRPPSQADGLKALVSRPSSGPNLNRWRQLMTEIPLDPWGNEYVYRYPAQKSGDQFDVYSWGPDRAEGGPDDMGNWSSNGPN